MCPSRCVAVALVVSSSAAVASGYQCDPSKVTKQELAYSGEGFLSVTPLCLGKTISGPVGSSGWFQGPSPTHSVADETKPNTLFFSWTEDTTWGASESGGDGKIHVTKVEVSDPVAGSAAVLTTRTFDGFMRAAGIAMTGDGVVGTLCAKHIPAWLRGFITDLNKVQNKDTTQDGAGPLCLAVCSVDSTTMQQHGQPWRIGKYWDEQDWSLSRGRKGNYPVNSWPEHNGNGYGWLTYAPSKDTWTAWYGATWGSHNGYAMHTYFNDAEVVDTSDWTHPSGGVESRNEGQQNLKWNDHQRHGTGDHQAGSITRYHPLNGDIYIMKHWGTNNMYIQQYGLAELHGDFFHEKGGGHDRGRVEVVNSGLFSSEGGKSEGAMRPCGDGMILGFVSEKGNICARVSKTGEFTDWKVISHSLPEKLGERSNRWVRLATLGSKESEAKCSRFLYGYVTEGYKRWLVEVDGACNMLTVPMEVTELTTWPQYQEWSTMANGAVTWVTAWLKTEEGTPSFNSWGVKTASDDGAGRGGVKTYGSHSWPEGSAEGSRQEAQLTIYWPGPIDSAAGIKNTSPRSDAPAALGAALGALLSVAFISASQ